MGEHLHFLECTATRKGMPANYQQGTHKNPESPFDANP